MLVPDVAADCHSCQSEPENRHHPTQLATTGPGTGPEEICSAIPGPWSQVPPFSADRSTSRYLTAGAEPLVHLDHMMEVRNGQPGGLVQGEEPAAPGRRRLPLRRVGLAAEEVDEGTAPNQRRAIAAIRQAAVRHHDARRFTRAYHSPLYVDRDGSGTERTL